MGSDMYMAERSWSPRPSKAEWDGDELVIYTDCFDGYSGIYREFWRGPVTDSNESLIRTLINNIPEKPPVIVPAMKKVRDLLEGRGPISVPEAQYLAEQIDEFYSDR